MRASTGFSTALRKSTGPRSPAAFCATAPRCTIWRRRTGWPEMESKFRTAAEAVALIRDGDTVGLMGGGGGLMEASCLFGAVEQRFLATGHPRDLAVVHALGIGDR